MVKEENEHHHTCGLAGENPLERSLLVRLHGLERSSGIEDRLHRQAILSRTTVDSLLHVQILNW